MIYDIPLPVRWVNKKDIIDLYPEKPMEVIKGKQILNRRIKEIIWDEPESNLTFPQVLTYCEGMGKPLFKITIEKNQEDFFVDEKGQKWVKA